MNVTKRQLEALDFIKLYIQENRIAPSFAEIGEALGLKSKNAVHGLVSALEHRGKIRTMPRQARAIEVLE